MLSLSQRNRNPEVGPRRESELWDPFRIMREVVGWDPFHDTASLTERLVYSPPFEVKEIGGSYVFKADLPGVQENDLEISLTGNRLTISGKREQEKTDDGQRYFSYERSFGTFSRSFTLPDGCDADQVAADLKGGVLTLVVPKKPEVQPRKIRIAGTAKA